MECSHWTVTKLSCASVIQEAEEFHGFGGSDRFELKQITACLIS